MVRRVLWRACLVALLAAAVALSEPLDGVGWQRAHVGRVTHAALAGHRAYVTTLQGVVACLSLRTGTTEWRVVLDEGDAIDESVFTSKSIVTLSDRGRLLRAWSTADGALLWEEALYSSAGGSRLRDDSTELVAKPALLLTKRGELEAVAALSQGRVQLRSAADGTLLWDADVSAHAVDAELTTLVSSRDGRTLFVTGLILPSTLAAVSLDLATGSLIARGSTSTAHELVSPSVVLFAASEAGSSQALLVAADAAGERLVHVGLADLVNGKAASAATTLLTTGGQPLLPASMHRADFAPLRPRALGAGLVSLETRAGVSMALLHAALAGNGVARPAVAALWAKGAALSSPTQLEPSSQTVYVAAALRAAGNTTVEVLDAASGAVVHTEHFPALHASSHGEVAATFLGGYKRRDGGLGFRFGITSDFWSVALLQQAQVVWLREEALAEVSDTLLLEPADKEAAEHLTSASGLTDFLSPAVLARVASDVAKSLTGLVQAASPSSVEQSGHGARTSLNQVVLVLTNCGKVYGLSSDQGRVLWSWLPNDVAAPARGMTLWRSGRSPLVLLVGASADGSGTWLVWLDVHTGAVGGSGVLPLRASRLVPLSSHDASGRRIVLLWEPATGETAVFPDTAEAAALAEAAAQSLFLHTVDCTNGTVTGYALSRAPLRAVPTWSVVLHSLVLATAARSHDDVVFSRTRVRGDRSMAYKYLNPNTVLVLTSAADDVRQPAPAVEAFVLDTITGRFLYRVRHAGASGPVVATAADNWFVYAYWSASAQRTEVSVLELFEDGAGRSSGSLAAAVASALTPHAAGNTPLKASSLAPPTLRVLGQTYSLSTPISALGVTVTRRGLTSRHVLLGTRTGRLVALDRRFVDPRRPTRPSAADREEGLVPYSEALPLLPGAHLMGASRAARLRGIDTTPAALESASHVLAYGLDLFYTRTAPSQTFDTLGRGFSRVLLAATLTLLSVGAAAAGWAVRRDDLARRWQ